MREKGPNGGKGVVQGVLEKRTTALGAVSRFCKRRLPLQPIAGAREHLLRRLSCSARSDLDHTLFSPAKRNAGGARSFHLSVKMARLRCPKNCLLPSTGQLCAFRSPAKHPLLVGKRSGRFGHTTNRQSTFQFRPPARIPTGGNRFWPA